MPDLSLEASSKYWFEYIDPMIYRVITFMESVEDWTLDGNPEFEQAMSELGKALDDIEQLDMSLLSEEEKFIRIVGNIKSGRGLRLLQTIDLVHPGSASRVLIHAEENSFNNDSASFFLKRNIVFERLRLLARVFCQYRLNLVLRALEGDE